MNKIYGSTWQKLLSEERADCRRLTFREESGLLEQVNRIQLDPTIVHRAFVMYENGTIVGWALAVADEIEVESDIMLYVKRDKRRKGYGSALFKRAKNWVKRRGDRYNYFNDPTNSAFFKAVDHGY